MAYRVDRKGAVIAHNRAHEKSPDQSLPTKREKAGNGKSKPRYGGIVVQPHEFGISCKVLNQAKVCFVMSVAQKPANMRPPQSTVRGRMSIFRLVRVLMMMAMVGCPPKRTLLHCQAAHKCKTELKETAGLERLVR